MSLAIIGEQLRWISVGDSPLYLYRDRKLHRLNETHSMASQIDMMVRCGELDPDVGRDHPQRHCLTSAITGGAIRQVDCPDTALRLKADDIVILASDGLNAIPDHRICAVVKRHRRKQSDGIVQALLRAVRAMGLPHQDNVSLVVIKMQPAHQKWQSRVKNAPRALLGMLGDASDGLSTITQAVLRPANRREEFRRAQS